MRGVRLRRIAERPMVRRSTKCLALAALLPLVAACGSSIRNQAHTSPPPPPVAISAPTPAAPVAAAPVDDPVLALIAESDKRFEAGRHELEAGHMAAAKAEFDRAVDVLIDSPYGGRTEPRIREHFDRLIERISTYEVKALADGDGFTETQSEPASIDELLAMSATLTTPVAPGLEDAVSTDLQTGAHDIPIPLNQRVLSFIELFQGRLHDFLLEGMQRGSRYLPMIQNVFRAEGLPLDLAYVPLVESAFKPNALSRTKAKGVWQFMSGTGKENGLRQDWFVDERSDPEKSTVAAAKYLSTLAKMFDGDWHLALASYNGGPGRLQRALKAGHTDDFWTLASNPRLLPRETRDYVPMILAAVIIARNPAQYGFDFQPDAPQQYDRVVLSTPVDLRRVAEWTDTSITDIQQLNPELRRWTTPVREDSYTLKVPTGTGQVVEQQLALSATTELASLNWYTVKKGDTLAAVAKKLRVSRTELASANDLGISSRISVGQKLIVPREATKLMAARTSLPVPVADSRATTADRIVATNDIPESSRTKVLYQVKRGDTLGSIARAFSTTIASIKSWNRLTSTNIQAGARLTIYTTARAN
jgi:membrane-bound lytic murein transglycosylase D